MAPQDPGRRQHAWFSRPTRRAVAAGPRRDAPQNARHLLENLRGTVLAEQATRGHCGEEIGHLGAVEEFASSTAAYPATSPPLPAVEAQLLGLALIAVRSSSASVAIRSR